MKKGDLETVKSYLKYIFAGMLFVAVVFNACNKLNNYLNLPDDNPLEQAVEAVIKEKTGIDVDLTP